MSAPTCEHGRPLTICAVCALAAEELRLQIKMQHHAREADAAEVERRELIKRYGAPAVEQQLGAIDPGAEPNRNPARTSVAEILARIAKYDGAGIEPNEVRKLATAISDLQEIAAAKVIVVETPDVQRDAERYRFLRRCAQHLAVTVELHEPDGGMACNIGTEAMHRTSYDLMSADDLDSFCDARIL